MPQHTWSEGPWGGHSPPFTVQVLGLDLVVKLHGRHLSHLTQLSPHEGKTCRQLKRAPQEMSRGLPRRNACPSALLPAASPPHNFLFPLPAPSLPPLPPSITFLVAASITSPTKQYKEGCILAHHLRRDVGLHGREAGWQDCALSKLSRQEVGQPITAQGQPQGLTSSSTVLPLKGTATSKQCHWHLWETFTLEPQGAPSLSLAPSHDQVYSDEGRSCRSAEEVGMSSLSL